MAFVGADLEERAGGFEGVAAKAGGPEQRIGVGDARRRAVPAQRAALRPPGLVETPDLRELAAAFQQLGPGGEADLPTHWKGAELAVARLRDLAWLLAVAALASALTAALIVAIYLASGLLAREQVLQAATRYALGDFLGVILTAPLLLRLPKLRLRRFAKVEWAALATLIGGLLWLVFAYDPDETFKHFYVLFIPLAWAAARDGVDGAGVASLLI